MKKNVSINNNTPVARKEMKNLNDRFFLKPTWFSKFTNETLFYIFYFMTKDTLQLIAAEELYKRNWRYHSEYLVWFCFGDLNNNEKNEKIGTENYMYFNPNEWKIMKYSYGLINPKGFLSESEVLKYNKSLNI
jgi:CCR4-NOT transcriptional regulation complex NOT5 subunit